MKEIIKLYKLACRKKEKIASHINNENSFHIFYRRKMWNDIL